MNHSILGYHFFLETPIYVVPVRFSMISSCSTWFKNAFWIAKEQDPVRKGYLLLWWQPWSVVRLSTHGPKGSEQGSKTLVGWVIWWIIIPQQTSRMECHMVFVEFRASVVFPWSNEYHASLPKISRLHHHPCPVGFFGVCRRCTLRATRATTISSWLLLPAPSLPLMVWRSAMEKTRPQDIKDFQRFFFGNGTEFQGNLSCISH